MSTGMSTVDWLGVVGPIVFYVVSLVVYYVYEGRREKRLNERYRTEEEPDGR